MAAEKLLRDPVFQLNLLLWMSKEQPPDDYYVRPVFYDLRFQQAFIEQPFKFPIDTINRIIKCPIEISREPEPELILTRSEDMKALYYECKSQSFGPESSTSKQARGHLIATGPSFAEVYRPIQSAQLCYVVPHGNHTLMASCLSSLTNELKNESFDSGCFSVHGLRIEGTDLIYSWDESFRTFVKSPSLEATVISNITPGTSPIPLLLVYSDEDCPDIQLRNFYRQAFLNQLRATLLCEMHANSTQLSFSISTEDFLSRATHKTTEFLGRKRKRKLIDFVGEKVFDFIVSAQHTSRGDRMSFDQGVFSIKWISEVDRDDFMTWLEDRRVSFSADKSETGDLFQAESDT